MVKRSLPRSGCSSVAMEVFSVTINRSSSVKVLIYPRRLQASDVYNYGVTILACLSFLNMILLIISTTYACCMIEGCICCCDIERRVSVGLVIFPNDQLYTHKRT